MDETKEELLRIIGELISVVIAADEFTNASFITGSGRKEIELRQSVDRFRKTATYQQMEQIAATRSPLADRIAALEKRVEQLESTTTISGYVPPIFCLHNNERPPGSVCKCPANCYCKHRTCL